MELPESGKLRRTVLDTTIKLSDGASEDVLLEALPYLHVAAWDEVVEERWLGKICGFPTCARSVRPKMKQKWHIDRESKTVFETSSDRAKFCCKSCFSASAGVREQLQEDPLWLTGETPNRMKQSFNLLKGFEQKEEPMCVDGQAEAKLKLHREQVRLVRDKLIAKTSELRIRDKSDTEDEKSDDDDVDKPLGYQKCSDDEDFLGAVHRYISCRPKPETSVKTPDLPKKNDANVKATLDSKADALERIRQKYKKRSEASKNVLIIDPKRRIDPVPRRLTTDDAEKRSEPVGSEPSSESNDTLSELESMKGVIKSWLTDESRNAIRSGCRPTGGEVENVLLHFLGGKDSNTEMVKVDLPDVDGIDVGKRRLFVLMQSLRPMWRKLETRLDLDSTKRDTLSRLLSTFALDADNVAGFTNLQRRVLCLALWQMVCRSEPDLNSQFYPDGRPSPAVASFGLEVGLVDESLAAFTDFVNSLLLSD